MERLLELLNQISPNGAEKLAKLAAHHIASVDDLLTCSEDVRCAVFTRSERKLLASELKDLQDQREAKQSDEDLDNLMEFFLKELGDDDDDPKVRGAARQWVNLLRDHGILSRAQLQAADWEEVDEWATKCGIHSSIRQVVKKALVD